MRIKINIQIFAIIIILILTKQIELYAWLMLFILIHELAHMFTGLFLKLKPKTLEIQPFGIGIVFESFENTEKNKIIIAIAGPLINIIIAIFNLLPISPLDGGQILNRILRIIFGNKEAYTITNSLNTIIMSVITAISSILILYLKNISIVIILIFMWYLVFKENQKYNEIQKYFKCVHKLDKKSNYNI